MNKNYLLGLVGIAILAAAGWYLLSGQNKTATSGTPAPGQTNVPEMVVGSGSTKETLTFNGSSFDRKVLEVKRRIGAIRVGTDWQLGSFRRQ